MDRLDINRIISRLVQTLVQGYAPEKIILFGSAANGNFSVESDFDIAVIKQTNKRFYDRVGDVLRIVREAKNRPAIDFFVYTPEEFRKGKNNNYFIKDEIEKKGRVLYERK